MAATRVKATPYSHAAAATTFSVSFGSLPAAGNCVIVAVNQSSGQNDPFLAGQVTDNQTGNTYTLAIAGDLTATNTAAAAIYYCPVIGTPSGTFTVTYTGGFASSQYGSMIAVEWSGLAASPLDSAATKKASGTGTAPSVATGTLAQANELIVAQFTNEDPSAAGTGTKDAAFTEDFVELDGTDYGVAEGSYRIVASTASVTSTWTSGNYAYSAVIASFKVAAAGGGMLPARTPASGSYNGFPFRMKLS